MKFVLLLFLLFKIALVLCRVFVESVSRCCRCALCRRTGLSASVEFVIHVTVNWFLSRQNS